MIGSVRASIVHAPPQRLRFKQSLVAIRAVDHSHMASKARLWVRQRSSAVRLLFEQRIWDRVQSTVGSRYELMPLDRLSVRISDVQLRRYTWRD